MEGCSVGSEGGGMKFEVTWEYEPPGWDEFGGGRIEMEVVEAASKEEAIQKFQGRHRFCFEAREITQ